jgi:hypothetical protein
MSEIYCFSFVEDEPSAEVLKKLVEFQNAQAESSRIHFREGFPKVLGGYGQIKKRAQALLQMARSEIYTLVLTDLDQGDCAPTLIRTWFSIAPKQPVGLPHHLFFRVAVREIEAWIMADRNELAQFLSIPVANFPKAPDDLQDPKRELLGIIRRKGHRAWHREMLPRGTANVGPRYNEKICEFIVERWKLERAVPNSPSLCRATQALSRL